MSAPIVEGIDPLKMADYACNWEQTRVSKDNLGFPLLATGSGKVPPVMLGIRWQQSPCFPA